MVRSVADRTFQPCLALAERDEVQAHPVEGPVDAVHVHGRLHSEELVEKPGLLELMEPRLQGEGGTFADCLPAKNSKFSAKVAAFFLKIHLKTK